MEGTLRVHELYLSLQGESTWSGLPCLFLRLTACNLRCSYCDTAYAFTGGTRRSLDDLIHSVTDLARPFTGQRTAHGHRLPLVELTGGEPLLQPEVLPLMTALADRGFTVLLETSGALDISPVDPRVHRIVDLKCPASGESHRNRWENLPHLTPRDEIKFVIATREDYEWARSTIAEHHLHLRCPLLFSWVHPLAPGQSDPSLKSVPAHHSPIDRRELVERMIADAVPARFQAQLHKIIWPPEQRGV